MIRFYGYKKCGTCRKAEKKLEEMGKEYEFIDITLSPPSKKELKEIVEKSGLDLKKFFNTSGEVYRELQIKDLLPTMTKEKAIDLLSKNGRLIKRPLVTDGGRQSVGYSDEDFAKTWKR